MNIIPTTKPGGWYALVPSCDYFDKIENNKMEYRPILRKNKLLSENEYVKYLKYILYIMYCMWHILGSWGKLERFLNTISWLVPIRYFVLCTVCDKMCSNITPNQALIGGWHKLFS